MRSLVTVPPGASLLAGWLTLLFPLTGIADEKPVPERGESERIRELKLHIEILREGIVSVEQTFRIGVSGDMIKRGPILNYLTVFQGPGGLTLDNGMEIEKVMREGAPEPFHTEKRDGFITLFIGSPGIELEHRDHTYTVVYRTGADWRQMGGEFTTVIDVVRPLPLLPIDRVDVRIQFPAGVVISKFTPGITGFERGGDQNDPGFVAEIRGSGVNVGTTRALGENRDFFVNLAWPSGTFARQSQWMKVMTQHPRIPLAAFSAVLLLWALVALLRRAWSRRF